MASSTPVLSKFCKDGEEWRDTSQLGTGDLLNAAKRPQRAEEFYLSVIIIKSIYVNPKKTCIRAVPFSIS
jgi:hypothetical protein